MGAILTKKAQHRSTYKVEVTFEDEDGNLVDPTFIGWTLLDNTGGSVVNSRDGVTVTSVSGIATILLQGDDLDVDEDGHKRTVVVSGTYNSSLGNGLPLSDNVTFFIECV